MVVLVTVCVMFQHKQFFFFFLEKAHYCLTLLLMSPYDIIRIHKPIMVPFSFLVFSVSLITSIRAVSGLLSFIHSFLFLFLWAHQHVSEHRIQREDRRAHTCGSFPSLMLRQTEISFKVHTETPVPSHPPPPKEEFSSTLSIFQYLNMWHKETTE